MKKKNPYSSLSSVYGGSGWSPRIKTHQEEIGTIWSPYKMNNEWDKLQAVLLHPPGKELLHQTDPVSAQMFDVPVLELAQAQHHAMAAAYINAGVIVHFVNPDTSQASFLPPNLIFCADLFFMTPFGAILARPASTVRAGEERFIAARLAALGIPIIGIIRGTGTFEGADAMWIDNHTVLLGRGLRTNNEALTQLQSLLHDFSIESHIVDLPIGSMHLMGMLRIVSADLAIVWPGRLAANTVGMLQSKGYQVEILSDESEAINGMALNFVTLSYKNILMAAGNPISLSFYQSLGITCSTVEISELTKAAGGIACLTGILSRE